MLLGCAISGNLVLGCFRPDDGREPPLGRIYFPTGLALSSDGDRLYVANSDWDLQFNAGSVQVYDAEALRALLPRHCESDADCAATERCDVGPGAAANGFMFRGTNWCVDATEPDVCRGFGVQIAADRIAEPGLCGAVDNLTPGLLLDNVGVGAFATDLIYRANPAGGGRLFVPVRSDATLHWIDVQSVSGRELECGQGADGHCDAEHRRRDAPATPERPALTLPIEPFGIDADASGTTIVTTHQTEGSVSLFVNDWEAPETGPELTFVLDGLPLRPVHVSAIPMPSVALLDRAGPRALGYQPGYWVTFRGTPFTALLRYFDEIDAPRGRPFLETAFLDLITTTSTSDIRGMTIDSARRDACEAACGDDVACLTPCASIALDVYLANRSPNSLVIGNTTSTRRSDISNDRLHFSDLVPVDVGASRITMGNVRDAAGELAPRVFLTSFDARTVTIFDPAARAIEAVVPTGRGPSALAIDSERALAYVAHFTDSYIGVIDLDRRHPAFGTLILALGEPSAPRGDQ